MKQSDIHCPVLHRLLHTALPMRVPRNTAVRRVRPEFYPLVASRAENAVRLELGHAWVRAQIVDAFLLCALRTSPFYRRAAMRYSESGVESGGACGGTGRRISRLDVGVERLRWAAGIKMSHVDG
jgi:hypothetical protein